MSPTVNIRKRPTRTPRYEVRYRLGVGATPYRSAGTFDTRSAAQTRRRVVEQLIAEGKDPRRELAHRAEEPTRVEDAADAYGVTHGSESAKKRHRQAVARLGDLRRREAAGVSVRDIQNWLLANADLAPASLRQYLGELRRIFAFAEIHPNPCEWSHLRVPGAGRSNETDDPPSLAELTAVLDVVSPKYVDSLLALEGTGLRIGELRQLRWRDIDSNGGRLRVGRTKDGTAGLRFVPMLQRVHQAVNRQRPVAAPDPDALVFAGLSDNGLRNALARACRKADTRHFSPHDLRHRFTSLLGLAGIPLPLIREIIGHTKNSITLDVYTHALLDETEERLEEIRRAVGHLGRAQVRRADRAGAYVGPSGRPPE